MYKTRVGKGLPDKKERKKQKKNNTELKPCGTSVN